MYIADVHNMFRSFAQEQGMQTIRAILPEDIDICLNTATINIIQNLVRENVKTGISGRIIQTPTISPINSIRTLYKNRKITDITGDGSIDIPYRMSIPFDNKVMYYTGITNHYLNKLCKVRFIEGESLEDTMNDYCNRCTWDKPIANIFSDESDNTIVEIYTEDDKHKLLDVKIKYIEKPNQVRYDDDINNCIHPNVPEDIIPNIVTHAVNIYFNSIGATAHNPN